MRRYLPIWKIDDKEKKLEQTRIGKKETIAYWVIAAVIVTLLNFVVWKQSATEENKDVYPIVVLGDSVFGLCRDETSIPSKLEEELGVSVLNGAFGGSYMALLPKEEAKTNYNMELLNMVSLSKAILAENFSTQRTIRNRKELTDYFPDTIEALSRVDFEQVDTLILAYGINDYHAGISLENQENLYDEYTFAGATRSVISSLQTKYPDMRIIVVTPTYAWYLSNGLTCEEYVTGDYYLEDYANKLLEIADELGVEAVDFYHDRYPHEQWEDWKAYTIDGLHPNEEGRKMLAEILAQEMKKEIVE